MARVLQVGIRDFCEEERDAIDASEGRIQALFDHEWAEARLRSRDLYAVVRRALTCLPQDVYVTFDVDVALAIGDELVRIDVDQATGEIRAYLNRGGEAAIAERLADDVERYVWSRPDIEVIEIVREWHEQA